MKFSNTVRAVFASALILTSALTSACADKKQDISGENVTTPASQTAATTTADPNIPDFTVGSANPATQPPAVTEPEIQQTESGTVSTAEEPVVTEPPETAAPATEPPVTAPPAAVTEQTQQTDSEGYVIDDWSSGLDLKSEDPDELLQAFGIDKEHRSAYNVKISSETALPIIHITTKNNAEILSLDEYIDCFVEVLNCDDIYKMEATSAEVRVRGNASAFYGDVSKIRKNGAPYRIKFTEKQSMLGLNDFARCRSWVLLRTYETGVNDYLAFNLAKAINNGDYYSSDAAIVQLYINEEYAGPYVLCEQTQANSERIDITEPENGYTGTDIGYLVELDNYAEKPFFYITYNKEPITDVYGTTRVPRRYTYAIKSDTYSDEQRAYIERYFEIAWEIPMRAIRDGQYYKFDEELNLIPAQEEFSSAYDCISQVVNIDSVVDMYITHEITNNQDVGGGSFFFAVDFAEGSKYPTLTMVSPWDFDWAYADYSSKADGGLYAAKFKDSYFVEHWGDRSNPWLILFYSADWFQDLVKQKWQERYSSITAAAGEVENFVVNYSDELNKDGTRRSGRAITIVHWAQDRIEYLNTLWG